MFFWHVRGLFEQPLCGSRICQSCLCLQTWQFDQKLEFWFKEGFGGFNKPNLADSLWSISISAFRAAALLRLESVQKGGDRHLCCLKTSASHPCSTNQTLSALMNNDRIRERSGFFHRRLETFPLVSLFRCQSCTNLCFYFKVHSSLKPVSTACVFFLFFFFTVATCVLSPDWTFLLHHRITRLANSKRQGPQKSWRHKSHIWHVLAAHKWEPRR